MIKINDVRETKCYSRDKSDKLIAMNHTLDTRIEFDSSTTNIIAELVADIEQTFGFKLNPVPLYITGEDTFYTFEILSDDKSVENKA